MSITKQGTLETVTDVYMHRNIPSFACIVKRQYFNSADSMANENEYSAIIPSAFTCSCVHSQITLTEISLFRLIFLLFSSAKLQSCRAYRVRLLRLFSNFWIIMLFKPFFLQLCMRTDSTSHATGGYMLISRPAQTTLRFWMRVGGAGGREWS